MRKWILVCLCLMPASGRAGDELRQAQERFGSMQYEQALKLVQRALSSPDNGPQELVAGYRLEGLCLSALGRPDDALEAFRKLLAIEPGYRLGGDFSPKLTAPFQRALAKAKELGPIGLMHHPPEPPKSLAGFELKVTLLSDPLNMVGSIRLTYFGKDSKPMRKTARVEGPGELELKLPKLFKASEVSYFFEAANQHGGVLALAGSREKPYRLETKAVSLASAPPEVPVLPVAPAPQPRWAREEESNGETAWYETWWFWTVVGVVVAGAATGTALALTSGDSDESVDYPVEWGVRP